MVILGIAAGLVPLMLLAVILVANEKNAPLAIWIGGASPVATLIYGVLHQLNISDFEGRILRSISLAFYFWGSIHLLGCFVLTKNLWERRRALKIAATR
jgi:hypothetical protein